MSNYQEFKKLNESEGLLLIGNAWDAGSARMMEQSGFKAIGTSSSALANALGKEDGQNISFEDLIWVVSKITEATRLPLTVDLERGYSDSVEGIVNNLERLSQLGVVGINLEDSTAEGHLVEPSDFAKRLQLIKEGMSKKGVDIFVNVRTDAFLLDAINPLEETITRSKQYQDAGADGIFVPCIQTTDDIEAAVNGTRLPLNVMAMRTLPDLPTLTQLGVKRLSFGGAWHRSLNKHFRLTIEEMMRSQIVDALFS